MPTTTGTDAQRRTPLSRDRVLRAAVALADEQGIDALTMRNLGQQLGVEAMSLYNHVRNKDDVLAGMVDVIVDDIDAAAREIDAPASDWKTIVRRRALAAREIMLRHPWAPPVIETRTAMTPTLLRYFDSLLGILRAGGFSLDLAHHAMHALGSRGLGFTQELFVAEDDDVAPDVAIMVQRMAREYPNISAMIAAISHDEATTLIGCDDQVEFEFGLDLILDGLERLRASA